MKIRRKENRVIDSSNKEFILENEENSIDFVEEKSIKDLSKDSLMTGISYIIPLIVAGGMVSSLALMFFGADGVKEVGSIGYMLKNFGGDIMKLMVPLLSGYMAYSLAEKPGLIPGIAGGIAVSTINGGFIGGIISGYLAGYFMRWFKKIRVNKTFEGLLNMLVYPLVGTLFVGIIILFIIGRPITFINISLVSLLDGLSGTNEIILAIIIGFMTCLDLGGPINKAAFAFCLGAIQAGNGLPYAAFSVAKCIPGVSITLATLLTPKYFDDNEKKLGKTSWFIGLCGITEVVIPFAVADPFITIPSFMIAGAVGSAISYVSGCSLLVAGGSIFTIPVTSNPVMWMVAILISSITGALCIVVGRKIKSIK